MGRGGKIPLQLINDAKKRRITYLRRKESLVKKARELSTLCDVDVSMLIICSDDQQGPEIFPQNRAKLDDMIKAYKTIRVTDSRKIKSYSLRDFFKDRKNKIEHELATEKKRNLEAKFPTSFQVLDNSSKEQLREVANKLETKIEQVETKKMSDMQNLGLQGWLKMPQLTPNPITMMTPFDYNNTSNMSDSYMESSGSSIVPNVDNGVYPIMPMSQNVIGIDQRLMQASNPSSKKRRYE